MSDLVASYLERLEHKRFSRHTIRAYAGDLRQAEKALGKSLVGATADELDAYVSGLARGGLKGTTLRRKQASLRGFFEHTRRAGVLTVDPTARFEPPKLEQRLPVYMNAGEVDQLFAVLGSSTESERREAAIVACLYYTGMRAGELVALDWEHITREGVTVFGKGRKERWLPMDERLWEVLELWREVHPGGGRGALVVALHLPHRGRRVTYKTINEIFQGARARAGLPPKYSPHKMRHTFATRLIRRVSIEKVQKVLGHRRIDTTTLYAHADIGSDVQNAMRGAL